ncbi:putative glycerol kinase 5 [Pectinophora gossypiella]|uniref:putative glycerol kinase 5 n=1 Tax=Pectinophora gossypiella TaxID=13191 RepID=UPI00214F5291|nr:putative glycerol kinase 5 [Pectinophora gossypiella]
MKHRLEETTKLSQLNNSLIPGAGPSKYNDPYVSTDTVDKDMEENYVLTLDIGTTTIRSFIYNSRAESVGNAVDQVVLHYPSPGFVEIDPDELWNSIVGVVQKSLKNANLSAGQMTAMGISTQRSTFITWSRETGKPFHRFITWKDLRADKLVKQWNHSYTWKLIRAGAYVLYLMSGSKRFRAGSVLKFMNTQTTLRLCWALQNIVTLKEAAKSNDAMFGTLDTWLLYRLTDKKVHMTDVSSASATGFFDPFTMQWAGWAMTLFGIQMSSLPTVVDTAGPHFTTTSPNIWGHPIPILSCMADQTASMWGSCCFEIGDVKLTMGTGTFFNINTGPTPHASVSGLYPVVGWRLGKELIYSAEGANNDTASIIKWAQNLGLFENPQETADIANSVPDSDGVYFIPAFSGLGPPYNDGSAASGFVGMKPSTTKAHLVRAVLESLAFRTAQLYSCVQHETSYSFHSIRLDGGVSNNDFIAQLVADLTGLRVERPVHVEMSSFGCVLIVGLQLGLWKSKEELKSLFKVGGVFHPRPQVKKSYEVIFARWEDAVKRMCGWYSEPKSSQTPSNSVSDSSSNSVTPQSSFKVASNSKRNGSYSKIKNK